MNGRTNTGRMGGGRTKVVVVGAGFGGLAVARGLHDVAVDVTIVDRNNFHTFQPLLYQVATSGLNPADVAYPVRGIFPRQRNVRFRRATVTGVDWERRVVEVRTGTTVAEVTPTRVRLGDGTEIPAHTLVWAAGVRASDLAGALDVPTGRGGRITVGPDLRIPGHPDAFAIGDIVAIDDAERGMLPGVAQVAMQSGHHVARLIERQVVGEGDSAEPFRYRDKGSMATIGRRSAVTELGHGVRLTGTPAWVAWLGLHLVYLMGFRNRVSVFVNWAWNYLTWDRGARLILGSGEAEPDQESEPSSPEPSAPEA